MVEQLAPNTLEDCVSHLAIRVQLSRMRASGSRGVWEAPVKLAGTREDGAHLASVVTDRDDGVEGLIQVEVERLALLA